MEDFGDVPLLSVDSFIDRVLEPPVDEAVLNQIRAFLVKAKYINKHGQWNGLSEVPFN